MEDVKTAARLEEQGIALKAEYDQLLDWQRRHYECQLAQRYLLIEKMEYNLKMDLEKAEADHDKADEAQPQD